MKKKTKKRIAKSILWTIPIAIFITMILYTSVKIVAISLAIAGVLVSIFALIAWSILTVIYS